MVKVAADDDLCILDDGRTADMLGSDESVMSDNDDKDDEVLSCIFGESNDFVIAKTSSSLCENSSFISNKWSSRSVGTLPGTGDTLVRFLVDFRIGCISLVWLQLSVTLLNSSLFSVFASCTFLVLLGRPLFRPVFTLGWSMNKSSSSAIKEHDTAGLCRVLLRRASTVCEKK